MTETSLNSIEYINDVIKDKTTIELIYDQSGKLIQSVRIGMKTIFKGKKWLIYVFICIFMLAILMVFDDLPYADPMGSYIYFTFENYFPFIFVFGCLILSLPISADEITDKMIDGYLVRSMKRETFWLSRWLVINIVVFVLNALISLVYYTYFTLFADQEFGAAFTSNIGVYYDMLLLIFAGTIIYSGLFLFVGMIGNKGFTFGIFLAIFEPLFLGLLFMKNSPHIPQTNVLRIASVLFEDDMSRWIYVPASVISTQYAWSYAIIFMLLVLISGGLYLRKREFN
jgi:hypothetical protein